MIKAMRIKPSLTLPFTRRKYVPLTAATLQQRYQHHVWRYVCARLGNTVEAEDVTAEVFAAAFERILRCPAPAEDIDAEDDPARAWVMALARNKTVDILRRRTRRPETPFTPETPMPVVDSLEVGALSTEAAKVLHTLLIELPALQCEALLLKYVDELSLLDIANILGKSPNAVGQLLHRARATMREKGRSYFMDDLEEKDHA
jgi:RNA polymerase sigma-70 factor, ECF subfamily